MKSTLCIIELSLLLLLPRAQGSVLSVDFESGNTGFVSDYTYNANDLTVEGYYSVEQSANDVHGSWVDSGDHTTGSGLFFVANGSPNPSDVVWSPSQAITVTQPNTPYRFEAWITSVYTVNNDGPILRFQVGNGSDWTDMGVSSTFPNGYTPGEWRLSFYDGKFSDAGIYYIRLLNDQTSLNGNDLGIDDITFGLSSESPSIDAFPVDNEEIVSIDSQPAGPLVPEPDTFALLGLATALLTCLRQRGKR